MEPETVSNLFYDPTFAGATASAKSVMEHAMAKEAMCFGLRLNLDPDEEQGEVLISIASVAKRVGDPKEFWPALEKQGFEVSSFGPNDVSIRVRKEVADLVNGVTPADGTNEEETKKNYATAIDAYRRAVNSKAENASAVLCKAISFVVGMPTIEVSCSKSALESKFGADDYASVIECLQKMGLRVKTMKRTRGDATGACTSNNIGVCISAVDEEMWKEIQAKTYNAYRDLLNGKELKEVLSIF